MSDYTLITFAFALGLFVFLLVGDKPRKYYRRRIEMYTAFMEFRRAGWPSLAELEKETERWKKLFHWATTDSIKKNNKDGQLNFFGNVKDKPARIRTMGYRYDGSEYTLLWKLQDKLAFDSGKVVVIEKSRRVDPGTVKLTDYVVLHPQHVTVNKDGVVKSNEVKTKDGKVMKVLSYSWADIEDCNGKVIANTWQDMPVEYEEQPNGVAGKSN